MAINVPSFNYLVMIRSDKTNDFILSHIKETKEIREKISKEAPVPLASPPPSLDDDLYAFTTGMGPYDHAGWIDHLINEGFILEEDFINPYADHAKNLICYIDAGCQIILKSKYKSKTRRVIDKIISRFS